MKRVLWTIQPEEVVLALLDGKPYRPDGRRVERSFRIPYKWMIEQLRLRVPGYAGNYPVWAYVDYRHDLRRYRHRITGRHGLLKLRIDESRLLLSDYDAWHMPLNNAPVFASTQEHDEYYSRWDDAVEQGKEAIQRFDLDEKKLVPSSWPLIFDLPLMLQLNEGERPGCKQIVQACFEEIRPEDVRSIKWVNGVFRPARSANKSRRS